MSPVQSMGTLAYRAAVHLYPPDFRREFGDEMTRDFVLATREAATEGDRRVFGLWARLGGDLLRSLAVQWLRSGLLLVALVAGLLSFSGVALAVRVLAGQSWVAPMPTPKDTDLLAFFLLIIVVLLIIVATIALTLWVTHTRLRRSSR